MANDHSKTTQTLFPLETFSQVSDHDFNIFHTIDRELYARLVQTLGRDPTESVQVMAFWIWLERETNDTKLVKRLLSLPPLLLNEIADEVRVCLVCLDSEKLQFDGEITLLSQILNLPVVSIRFFHENRAAVLRGIAKVISTVCVRAFRDIPGRVQDIGGSSREAERRAAAAPRMYNPHIHPTVAGGLIQMPASPPMGVLPIHMGGFAAFDLAAQRHVVLNNDLGNSNMNMNRREENVVPRNLPVDDRTIFLTFSKGYPTTEDEVKEYFTRGFGDFIEDLIFQDVGDDEQVLYARMVVKPVMVGVIEKIVGRGNKAKYTMNGKHVCARKYMKKSRSPPRDGRSDAAAAPANFQNDTL